MMPQSFSCPNCSAPLDVEIKPATTIRCPYCGTSVIVPEALRVKNSGSPVPSTFFTVSDARSQAEIKEKLDFIKETAVAGNKIVAVKAVRETFSIGLNQAVDLVEAMQRGEQVDLNTLQGLYPPSDSTTTLDPAIMQQILVLIRSGDKIGAIKLFRQATDVGLKDAKDAID